MRPAGSFSRIMNGTTPSMNTSGPAAGIATTNLKLWKAEWMSTRKDAQGGLGFINTYTENAYKTATLNKTDHFAFLKGYPDGGFAPGKNMSRAEVTTMFARLLTEQMEADKTYPASFLRCGLDALGGQLHRLHGAVWDRPRLQRWNIPAKRTDLPRGIRSDLLPV